MTQKLGEITKALRKFNRILSKKFEDNCQTEDGITLNISVGLASSDVKLIDDEVKKILLESGLSEYFEIVGSGYSVGDYVRDITLELKERL